MSQKKDSPLTGKRYSEEECIEILAHCRLIEQSIERLRTKALTDLEYRLNQPKLKVVE